MQSPAPDKDQLADLVKHARRIVAFTGAGVSTECGIPDFRSPGGLWSRFRPLDFQTFMASEEARREGLLRFLAIRREIGPVEPGRGHKAIAGLYRAGKVSGVITQNIDGLHQASGIAGADVVELHGNATYAACLDCRARHELDWVERHLERNPGAPRCRQCGGIIKTATISFGQAMPAAAMKAAESLSLNCDLFLALGSSLVVQPAASFPAMAKAAGACLVIVNRDPTPLDDIADLVIREDIGTCLSRLAVPPA